LRNCESNILESSSCHVKTEVPLIVERSCVWINNSALFQLFVYPITSPILHQTFLKWCLNALVVYVILTVIIVLWYVHPFYLICVNACLVCVRGFIKGRAPGKLTGCEHNFSHLVWQSRESYSYKEVQLKKGLPASENQLPPCWKY